MTSFKFPTNSQLDSLFQRHKGDRRQHGWRVKMGQKFNYYKPEEWYQAVVDQLVTKKTKWVDVGGGKSVMCANHKLACELAARSAYVVAVDPSNNIEQNDLVNERSQSTIEAYECNTMFNLATLRMVAEHIENPDSLVESLARLIEPGGYVVIYTPNKWSFMAIAASVIPNRMHANLTKFIWKKRPEEDVFPTHFLMNTRKRLKKQFAKGGFDEVGFAYLDDCGVLQRIKAIGFAQLVFWRMLSFFRLRYPENNLLGVYRKQ